ncbi:protein kinase [Nostoc linckia z18]|uniref:non-specific serine/threonine protein kinase n=3 Tax=Nostoc linckia TaxID=92942 RepID=A0A9Q6EHI7_NOSLI|nr:protein kinase [Nostoc linckia z1]PHJ70975.1 protein kinase [Nostoc linckia z3]PHJ74186.1 protein kinase [Nostoc linckia z2]PHJ79342.1 protein kinase [Nostoc linckia z4]PHJ87627.1 protein kinase [Nostoc linckia z6]PHJ92145.1 protein kinase [Nostoc linckia z8]PHJ94977.1 protein kinase [Nostoc linckia z7]PHK07913.1 protein kinase [Nostoc linckia z9]PHK19140.1 protein kinase [Nostoc linckia z14]PHK21034.1 protein kinase [Nostoc linckia z13]PHK30907.1 protein kinase [Nostoc linckia z18]PH
MVGQKVELDNYIGQLLNNRYLIRDLIGKGGMGRVYLAEDTAKGGMAIAIKILSLSLSNQHMSQRFAREIFIGAQLGRKSKHIVRILSYGVTEDKIPFYVMEYLQGKNLKQILKVHPLTISQFLEISTQICLGLQCAHQGISLKGEIYPIVHRDIKPENIFLTQDVKHGEIVKILDFGIAKFLTERSGMTLTDSFIGSLPYCSPEHMEGRKLLDIRSDIYSLGVLMFEMLTGKHPFQTKSNSFGSWYQAHRFQIPPTLEEVNPQVKIPQGLQKILMNCLAKEVSERPSNINQILDELAKVNSLLEDASYSTKNNVEIPSDMQLVPATFLSEKECLQKNWPKNKPVAPIGFPHLLHTPPRPIPTFWAMLPKQEIVKFLNKVHGTEFLTKMNVYPMLLWVTVLYDNQPSLTKWLPYFLDLKDNKGQNIARSLAEVGYYHLLFFPLEDPNRCSHVITLSLTANQRQQIIDSLNMNQQLNESILPQEAKNLLKIEYEKLKLDIVRKLIAEQKIEKENFKNRLAKFWEMLFKFLSLR